MDRADQSWKEVYTIKGKKTLITFHLNLPQYELLMWLKREKKKKCRLFVALRSFFPHLHTDSYIDIDLLWVKTTPFVFFFLGALLVVRYDVGSDLLGTYRCRLFQVIELVFLPRYRRSGGKTDFLVSDAYPHTYGMSPHDGALIFDIYSRNFGVSSGRTVRWFTIQRLFFQSVKGKTEL